MIYLLAKRASLVKRDLNSSLNKITFHPEKFHHLHGFQSTFLDANQKPCFDKRINHNATCAF